MHRNEYMQDSKNLHHEYYSQFVTNALVIVVVSNFSKDELCQLKFELENGNTHLSLVSGISLEKWDRINVFPFVDLQFLKECGEITSQATNVCIAKATMRKYLSS